MSDTHDRDAAKPASGETSSAAATAAPPPGGSLTHKAGRGFAWLIAQTVGFNLVNLLQFYVLGQVLSDYEWGLNGMVAIVASLLMSLQASGIAQLLVHRHAEYERWANAGFWISTAMGVVTAVAFVGAAPLLSWWYDEPGVKPLIWILAAAAPFNLMTAVPLARVSGQLRFRLMATIGLGWYAGLPLLSIVFALMGFGALSWVLPRIVLDPIRLALLMWVTKPPIRATPELGKWKHLLGDSMTLTGGSLVEMLIQVVELSILGRFHRAAAVGSYNFAWNLSRRPMQVLTGNLMVVLFPTLSTLQHDPKRQTAAFLRAAKVLAVMGMPVCLLLAALAQPVLHMFFGSKWDAAIAILVVLSAGMSVRLVGEVAGALLKAQGRFKLTLWMNVCYLVPFVIAVTWAAWKGTPLTVGIVVGIFSSIMGPAFVYVAIRAGGGRKRDVVNVYGGPTLASAAAVFAGWALAQLVPESIAEPWISAVQAAIICAVTAALYVPLVRWLAADAYGELMERIRAVRGRRIPQRESVEHVMDDPFTG